MFLVGPEKVLLLHPTATMMTGSREDKMVQLRVVECLFLGGLLGSGLLLGGSLLLGSCLLFGSGLLLGGSLLGCSLFLGCLEMHRYETNNIMDVG